MPEKHYLGMSVLEAARQRIAWTFDVFPRIYISFSGGKDSTVMLHMVMEEAIKRNRKVGLLHIDLEAWYKLSADHIQSMFELYKDYIEPYWVALPFPMDNSASMIEPEWTTWEPEREEDWIRPIPNGAITLRDANERLPFYRRGMEFEEFLPAFGNWYSQGKLCACFVGIRASESLNRWRTIAGHGVKFEERKYTNHVMKSLWNVYPIYDWNSQDIWIYHGKTNKPYNRVYDLMHRAGLTLHQMRICQPYGLDQRKGLWLFHVLEPETWQRIVNRVSAANYGAIYARTTGNILGNIKIAKPEGHTWESYANFLLDSMPQATAEHYRNKFAVYLKWYQDREFPEGIPDEQPSDLGSEDIASWRRLCKVLLRGDYFCRALYFNYQKSGSAHQRYVELMAKRRNLWGIYPLSGQG